ncbi:hypothetical protein [Shinella sp. HZN7]|uniref:hypothetical protein n=1 Tax=Shinella sp. (strain HZN7) TaxID=879274 RepID=UPI0007DA5723|nr:hypothetical protein [Shinella sp. HZN7]ANH03176.1 hypothetical protein shn_03390 [Shinella sp. HZN7]
MLKIDTGNLFKQRVAALFRMSPDQRRFYHMKRGFRFQRDSEPSKENFLSSTHVTMGQKNLYGNICSNDWNLLMHGFGRSLSEIFVDPRKRPNTNEQDLVSAEMRAELLNLFRSIYESM